MSAGAAGLFVCAAVAAPAGLAAGRGVWLLVAASAVFVAGVAVAAPSLIALLGSLAPRRRGAAVSLYSFVLFVGASLGPQLPPLALRLLPADGAAMAAVFAVLGGLFAAAAELNTEAPRRHASET